MSEIKIDDINFERKEKTGPTQVVEFCGTGNQSVRVVMLSVLLYGGCGKNPHAKD